MQALFFSNTTLLNTPALYIRDIVLHFFFLCIQKENDFTKLLNKRSSCYLKELTHLLKPRSAMET